MIIKQENKNCIVFLLAFFYTDLGDFAVEKIIVVSDKGKFFVWETEGKDRKQDKVR